MTPKMFKLTRASQMTSLSVEGVIAFDDIYNVVCPGVTEGLARYMLFVQRDIAPFATCGNKVLSAFPPSKLLWLRIRFGALFTSSHARAFPACGAFAGKRVQWVDA
jgi:hypothetical protein